MEKFLFYLPYIILLAGVGLTFCWKQKVDVKLAAMAVFFCGMALAFVAYDVGKIIFVVLAIAILLLNRKYIGSEIRSGSPFLLMMIAFAFMFAVDMAMYWLDNKLWQLCLQVPVAVVYVRAALLYAVKNSKSLK